jgi:FkbM family methyltransferase
MNYFFDIGSNIGQTFYWYLNGTKEFDGWTVFCFEPSPRNFNKLLKAIDVYKNRYNIIVCPFGLSDGTGVSEFFLKTDPAGDSYNKDWVINDPNQLPVLSPTIEAVSFIKQYTKENDNIVLKLDCEGYEYNILYNLLNKAHLIKRCSKIMVEWHATENEKNKAMKEDLINKYKSLGNNLELWNF